MKLKVNGKQYDVDVHPQTPLLWVIRDNIGLTGTKFGCGIAQCGACTIQLNGNAVRACVTPASVGEGKEITTIEGLSNDITKRLQEAWIEEDVSQCGYCQSGQIILAALCIAFLIRW